MFWLDTCILGGTYIRVFLVFTNFLSDCSMVKGERIQKGLLFDVFHRKHIHTYMLYIYIYIPRNRWNPACDSVIAATPDAVFALTFHMFIAFWMGVCTLGICRDANGRFGKNSSLFPLKFWFTSFYFSFSIFIIFPHLLSFSFFSFSFFHKLYQNCFPAIIVFLLCGQISNCAVSTLIPFPRSLCCEANSEQLKFMLS